MTGLQVRDLTPVIGAEIRGLNPKGRLDAETCRLLRRVFDEKGILLFRDLNIDRRSADCCSTAMAYGPKTPSRCCRSMRSRLRDL
jgi:taurine dioxygenase